MYESQARGDMASPKDTIGEKAELWWGNIECGKSKFARINTLDWTIQSSYIVRSQSPTKWQLIRKPYLLEAKKSPARKELRIKARKEYDRVISQKYMREINMFEQKGVYRTVVPPVAAYRLIGI